MELYNKRMIQILELLTQNRKVLSSDQIALSIGRVIKNDSKRYKGIERHPSCSWMQPFFPKQAVDII